MMCFVLEEASWSWDGAERDRFVERIQQLLDRLDVANERREAYAASSELLRQRVLPDYELCELLWSSSSPLQLPTEVMQRITAHFNQMRYWDEEEEWPAIEAEVAGRTVVSPSAAYAHARCRRGQLGACLPLSGTWRGPTEVTARGEALPVHFVVDEETHRRFFRDFIGGREQVLVDLAPHAFPDLHFLDGVWRGLGALEGGFARVRDALPSLLAMLDDHGAWVFTDETGRFSQEESVDRERGRAPVTSLVVQSRFKRWGLDFAPEHPDVRADGKSRRARERVLGGRTLYCEWHHKFEPHINRVHVHGPVPESRQKVVIAIFHRHLPLPGD